MRGCEDDEDAVSPSRRVSVSPTRGKQDEETHAGERVKALAKKSPDFADGSVKEDMSMEDLTQVAFAACLADLTTFGKILDSADDGRKALYRRMTPGLARVLRVIVTAEHPKTQMPEPAKPQCPDVRIGGTVANNPAIKNIGDKLTPTKEAVNFFTKSKFEADAAVPPYTPYPAPKLMESPWTPGGVDVERAAEASEAKRKKFGVEVSYPSLARLVLPQLRVIIAGEVAGAWGRFGGLGARRHGGGDENEPGNGCGNNVWTKPGTATIGQGSPRY